jgi:pentose-5-phosphate-3-epimerase
MLPEPESHVQACVDIGASRIIVHAGAGAKKAIEMLQDKRGGEYAVVIGVALASHANVEDLDEYAGLYDFVQVMGIDHIGMQGQPPDPHHHELALISALRAKFPDLVIQVDGAAAAHPRELVAAGANRLIVGSAIIQALNPKGAIEKLQAEANS